MPAQAFKCISHTVLSSCSLILFLSLYRQLRYQLSKSAGQHPSSNTATHLHCLHHLAAVFLNMPVALPAVHSCCCSASPLLMPHGCPGLVDSTTSVWMPCRDLSCSCPSDALTSQTVKKTFELLHSLVSPN